MKSLDTHRENIDKIDDKILELLNERAKEVIAIGDIKKKEGLPVWVPSREARIYERLSAKNKDGMFPSSSLRSVFREIISASAALEDVIKIAYLGPEGTYANLAGIKFFGLSAKLIPNQTIADVFKNVEKDRYNYGIVPIENSLEGVVNHSIDMFVSSNVNIVGELYMEIQHNLMSKTGNINDIKAVYSHPQGLAQCRDYINKTFKDIRIYETDSTADASKKANEDQSIASIGSEVCEALYGLKIIDRGIQDFTSNYTRFLIIGKDSREKTGNDKTSIMFSVSHSSGALFKALEIFSRHNINMSKIESRPIKLKAWEYLFYVDIDGHIDDEIITEALNEFKAEVQQFKILGSYPKGDRQTL